MGARRRVQRMARGGRLGVAVLCGMLSCLAVAQEDTTSTPADAPAGEVDDATGSPAPAEPVVRYMTTDPEGWPDALARERADELLELELDGAPLKVFARKERKAPARGIVILMADQGLSADAGWIGNLRRTLPDAGWYTLAVNMPGVDMPVVPARVLPAKSAEPPKPAEDTTGDAGADGADGAPAAVPPDAAADAPAATADASSVAIDVATGEAAGADAAESVEQQARARLMAVIAHARAADYEQLVLLGEGRAAQVLAGYVRDLGETLADERISLVWLRPTFSGAFVRDSSAVFAEREPWPVLELIDSVHTDDGAAERLGAARRAQWRDYRQERLPLVVVDPQTYAGRVSRRVAGWLNRDVQRSDAALD